MKAAIVVRAAELAKRGFVSCDDGVGGSQGFVDAHVDQAFEEAAWASPPPATFLFEDVKHKLHACCHGLHATIEALRLARRTSALDPAALTAVRLRVNPRWLKVCDIKKPRTGLEAKFSYAMVTAMTLGRTSPRLPLQRLGRQPLGHKLHACCHGLHCLTSSEQEGRRRLSAAPGAAPRSSRAGSRSATSRIR